MSGGGMQVFDLTGGTHAQQNWTTQVTGCDALLSANSPGFAYDAGRDRFVGWAGGNVVYLFDPDAKKCDTVTYGGGPKAQRERQTARFQSPQRLVPSRCDSPALRVLVRVVDDAKTPGARRVPESAKVPFSCAFGPPP